MIDLLRQNPLGDETFKEYCSRLGMTTDKLEGFLRRRGYKQGPAGLKTLRNENSQPFWNEGFGAMGGKQDLVNKHKSTTNYPKVEIDADKISVALIADLHIGSWGTDYTLFEKLTEEIKNTPNLYVILAGDLLQMSIKMRNVLEMSDNLLPPKWQIKFLDSWLSEIYHKVLVSTWDNHAVMREEAATGYSTYASIFDRKVDFSNGICHLDVKVKEQEYKIAVAHFFRGNSIYNPVHSHMRYSKFEGHDREIIMAGDSHVPGIAQWYESGKKKIALNCGSLQTSSGYGQRFFSLITHPVFPCVILSGETHDFHAVDSISRF